MKRVLFHGSDNIVKIPKFGMGKANNDYGLGFYCTEDPDLAREWAVRRERDGFVNKYTLDETGLRILNLESPEFTSLNWIELLLSHRVFEPSTPLALEAVAYLHRYFHTDIDDADVIVGYRADDSYFSYAQDFIEGSISCGQLYEALRLGKLGLQYVLKSKRAFDRIRFEESEPVLSQVWYPKRETRDRNARRDYYKMDTMRFIRNDLYMVQILDEEVKPGDLRIR